jgi:pimeloyl-ACP methyl ester carboxylesterase
VAVAAVNGIRLAYQDLGEGEPVVLVMGTGSGGRAWHLHQVPALLEAGHRVVTFDNRGIPPSDECAGGFTVHDLVEDVVGLVDHLGLGPCHFVGTSMGSYVVQELALAHPGLVRRAVLLATRGRPDVMGSALARAERELYDLGVALPPRYDAVVQALTNLSPRTLDDPRLARDWLEILELTSGRGAGVRAQLDLDPLADRLEAYRAIAAPCLVVAFEHDLVAPPYLGREVAEAIPGGEFQVVDGCGHYGYLEDPVTVNKSIVEFFRRS